MTKPLNQIIEKIINKLIDNENNPYCGNYFPLTFLWNTFAVRKHITLYYKSWHHGTLSACILRHPANFTKFQTCLDKMVPEEIRSVVKTCRENLCTQVWLFTVHDINCKNKVYTLQRHGTLFSSSGPVTYSKSVWWSNTNIQYHTHKDRKLEQPRIATNSSIYIASARHSHNQQAPEWHTVLFACYRRCQRQTETPTLSLPLSVMNYTERGMNW